MSKAEKHINLGFTQVVDGLFPFLELTGKNRKSFQGMNPDGLQLDQLLVDLLPLHPPADESDLQNNCQLADPVVGDPEEVSVLPCNFILSSLK